MPGREIDRFVVRAADGQEFTVIEYEEEVGVARSDDPQALIASLRRYETTEGWTVTPRLSVDYEVVDCPGGPIMARRREEGDEDEGD